MRHPDAVPRRRGAPHPRAPAAAARRAPSPARGARPGPRRRRREPDGPAAVGQFRDGRLRRTRSRRRRALAHRSGGRRNRPGGPLPHQARGPRRGDADLYGGPASHRRRHRRPSGRHRGERQSRGNCHPTAGGTERAPQGRGHPPRRHRPHDRHRIGPCPARRPRLDRPRGTAGAPPPRRRVSRLGRRNHRPGPARRDFGGAQDRDLEFVHAAGQHPPHRRQSGGARHRRRYSQEPARPPETGRRRRPAHHHRGRERRRARPRA